MSSLFSKLTACGLLVGGFAVTGDLGRLAERGTKLVNATGVPSDQVPPEKSPPVVCPPTAPVGAPAAAPGSPPLPAPPPVAPEPPSPRSGAVDGPVGRSAEPPRLPVSTPAKIDLGTLRPGQRLTIWAGSPSAAYAFDIVDPATGEVLEQSPAGGRPGMAPRRLRLVSDGPRTTIVTLNADIRLMPLGIARGTAAGPTDTLGPVRAIEVSP